MSSNKQHQVNRQGNIRPKSVTRYPKPISYVVAFSLREMYDNTATPQQTTCNNRSPQGSIHSICPSNLTKPDDRTVEKCEHIIDILEDDIEYKLEENNYEALRKVLSDVDTNVNAKDCQMGYDIVPTNRNEDFRAKYLADNMKEPEIIYEAGVRNNKTNKRHARERPRKFERISLVKKINFKYKSPRNKITTKLGKHYFRTLQQRCPKGKVAYIDFILRKFSENQIIKKVSAKENLLETLEPFVSKFKLNEKYYDSLTSTPSTARRVLSYTSGNTLVLKGSSSREDELYSIKNANSILEVASGEITPFKTDIFNVVMTVSCNPEIKESQKCQKLQEEMSLSERTFCKTETLNITNCNLTSEPPSNEESKIIIQENIGISFNDIELSSVTLTADNISSNIQFTDDEAFVLSKPSLEFDREENSDCTLTTESENILNPITVRQNLNNLNPLYEPCYKVNIRNTMLNVGMFGEMKPSTSSVYNISRDVNITNTNCAYNFKNKGDEIDVDKVNPFSKNVLKKPFKTNEDSPPHKNIPIPNSENLKTILKEHEKIQKKSLSEDAPTDYLVDLPEMWDRLLLALEITVQRLAETLPDKIVKGLIQSLKAANKTHPIPMRDVLNSEVNYHNIREEVNLPENENNSEGIKKRAEGTTQCELVASIVIDKLMNRLSSESPQIKSPASVKSLQKILNPSLIKDYFEVLKPPAVPTQLMNEKGDTVTVSATTVEEGNIEEVRFRRMRVLFEAPMNFLRENVLVLTSVPTFFVLLLGIYGLIFVMTKVF